MRLKHSLYDFFYRQITNSPNKYILALLTIIIPIYNIFVLINLLLCYGTYESAQRIYNNNHELVNDPFINMIFAPEMCI